MEPSGLRTQSILKLHLNGDPMYFFEIAALLIAIVVLAVGYRKNSRNLLLTGAIVLFIAGVANETAQGLIDGFHSTSNF